MKKHLQSYQIQKQCINKFFEFQITDNFSLERELNNYTCISKGDTINILVEERNFSIDILVKII